MQNAPREAFCNTFDLHYMIKLPFVLKIFRLSFFEKPIYTGFTVVYLKFSKL